MGLIGKIALIGVVSVAVLIAVIWDIKNEKPRENAPTTNAQDIKMPENMTTQETPSPETPQDQAPAVIEQSEEQARNPVEELGPGMPEPPRVQPEPPAVEPAGQQEPEQVQPAGTAEKYVIQKNDNLHKIARRFYGDSKFWRAIYMANTDVIPDPEVLKVGTEIVIPSREDVLSKKSGPAPPSVETYIVQPGDTLSSISRMHYGGDSSHAQLIYQANRDKITDKNVLKPGITLTIPALPEKSE